MAGVRERAVDGVGARGAPEVGHPLDVQDAGRGRSLGERGGHLDLVRAHARERRVEGEVSVAAHGRGRSVDGSVCAELPKYGQGAVERRNGSVSPDTDDLLGELRVTAGEELQACYW